jgi:hypothetical protein
MTLIALGVIFRRNCFRNVTNDMRPGTSIKKIDTFEQYVISVRSRGAKEMSLPEQLNMYRTGTECVWWRCGPRNRNDRWGIDEIFICRSRHFYV